jgi:hypothetical protein
MSLEKLLREAYGKAGVGIPSDESRARKKGTTKADDNKLKKTKREKIDSQPDAEIGKKKRPKKFDDVLLSVAKTAAVVWRPEIFPRSEKLLIDLPGDGRRTQLGEGDDADLCLGLDFGTSTLKAAIYDRSLTRSYAVQFRDIPGVDAYLLPCRVFKHADSYNLEGKGRGYHDLKLSLLGSPKSAKCQHRAVAFLALSLRRIRGWLFSEYVSQYQCGIVWNMSVGLPVAKMNDEVISGSYRHLMLAAWLVSCDDSERVTDVVVGQALSRAEALLAGHPLRNQNEEIEIQLVPEIAAQIYGFVSSHAYDPNASNMFLMVDIGAGTVDASVFRVDRPKGSKKDNFVIFNSFVEYFGVMNLHRMRMNFCRDLFEEKYPGNKELNSGVGKLVGVTDAEAAIPDRLTNYFSGVKFRDPKVESSIDQEVYSKVRNQVGSEAYAKLYKNHILPVSQIKGMPMLLCGGGSRMPLYQQLKTHMASSPGCSWFGVSQFAMAKPRDFVAKGIDRNDVDRLSVAYGLSKVDVGKIIYDVEPLPDFKSVNKYADNYVEK